MMTMTPTGTKSGPRLPQAGESLSDYLSALEAAHPRDAVSQRVWVPTEAIAESYDTQQWVSGPVVWAAEPKGFIVAWSYKADDDEEGWVERRRWVGGTPVAMNGPMWVVRRDYDRRFSVSQVMQVFATEDMFVAVDAVGTGFDATGMHPSREAAWEEATRKTRAYWMRQVETAQRIVNLRAGVEGWDAPWKDWEV